MANFSIDLRAHKNPAGFIADMQKRYPSGDVQIRLAGSKAEITVNDSMPLQMQINACTFLSDRAREEIFGHDPK